MGEKNPEQLKTMRKILRGIEEATRGKPGKLSLILDSDTREHALEYALTELKDKELATRVKGVQETA